MAKPLLTMKFTEESSGEINVSTKFAKDASVCETFELIGKGVRGLILTAQKLGQAKGMSEDDVLSILFPSPNEQASAIK